VAKQGSIGAIAQIGASLAETPTGLLAWLLNPRSNMKPPHPLKLAGSTKRPSAARKHLPDSNRYAVDYMDHAPVWPGPIFAPGLFRPTQNGAAATALEVTFVAKVGNYRTRYVLRSPEALNITDEAVYFYICQCIAAGKSTGLSPTHQQYASYRDAMAVNGAWANKTMAVVSLTHYDLAAGVGLTRTGTNARAMAASLNRLSQVTMRLQMLDQKGAVIGQGASRFLAFLCYDAGVGITLHFEAALFAHHHKGVAWINMREHRSLDSKPAKRLHAWLTAWASDKLVKLVGLEKLMTNVWGEPPATQDIRKDRKRTLRKAIEEVGRLSGWSCVYTEKGDQLLVRKPRFVGTTAQKAKAAPLAATTAVIPAATTPTRHAATPTNPAVTATKVAVTPTAVSLKSAPSAEVAELVFEL
jgi:Replication protein C (RepC)